MTDAPAGFNGRGPLRERTQWQKSLKHTTRWVVFRGIQVLLLARPRKGEIRLPKGHIDPDETPVETALRETVKETGYANLEIVADLG